jgi:hypothetical protein
MADQPEKSTSRITSSDFWGLFEMLFMGLALISFGAALCTLLYEAWGFVTGKGWNFIFVGDALDWFLGMPPPAENMSNFQKALVAVAILPLDITLAILGWLLSKISNGFEKLT